MTTQNIKQWGQFNTTNCDYILSNMSITHEHKTLIEPCFGDGDLVRFVLKTNPDIDVKLYDIDPTKKEFHIDEDGKATIKNTIKTTIKHTIKATINV